MRKMKTATTSQKREDRGIHKCTIDIQALNETNLHFSSPVNFLGYFQILLLFGQRALSQS